ncbi:hypothetical protein GALMADRAFT_725715 [Galerina marginata CBS 339.88]|uniref:Secreted protein n=1 Tax=Galerina marginata (strain CBS 339.88) TaxID=685588 RepID=A0A067SQR1_GALM3|nr:hypothetical protein GALMADRAFT_725715 [Galerina marginata CBS 339.88]
MVVPSLASPALILWCGIALRFHATDKTAASFIGTFFNSSVRRNVTCRTPASSPCRYQWVINFSFSLYDAHPRQIYLRLDIDHASRLRSSDRLQWFSFSSWGGHRQL